MPDTHTVLPIDKILHGDSRVVLKKLPDACVDSIVTDPPAGISFMSKDWDNPDAWKEDLPSPPVEAEVLPTSGRLADRDAFIVFLRDVMGEAFRVLKPGGFALVWSIPRTSHWTATALEEAGFETRDCIYHVFGCLSEDTEILTEHGWEPYHTLEENRLAMCYDAGDDSFQWQPIQQVFTYPYKDTAYRLYGDHTDQLVSRNHRCLVERSGATVFEYAEALKCQESVPVLENVRALLEALPLPNQGAGCSQSNLFPAVCVREHGSQEQGPPNSSGRVQDVWDRVQTQEQRVDSEGGVLRVQMSGHSSTVRSCVEGSAQEHSQAWTPGLDRSLSCLLQQEDVGARQSCLEGRSNLFLEARELRVGEVRPMSVRVPLDGPQRRVRGGTSTGCSQSSGEVAYTLGVSASLQSRSYGQPGIEFGPLPNEQGSQIVRASRFTTSDLVRVEPVPYEGIVWCVRVPSGSFVARRAGKAFVTGNSGFPKSLNIGKAIDKAAVRKLVNVERVKAELIKAFDRSGKTRTQIDKECGFRAANYLTLFAEGNRPDPWVNTLPSQEKWQTMKDVLGLTESDVDGQLDEWFKEAEREIIAYKKTGPGVAFSSVGPTEVPITLPATEDAKKWEGWGTALKPAVECWWLVRKPIEESTIAAQVLATGTGGINIDATRVKHANAEDLEKHVAMVTAIKARGGSMKDSWKNSSDLSGANDVKTEGRWPANLVLTHSSECRQVGTQTVPAPVINRFDDGMKPFGNGAGHSYTSSGGGHEEVPVFECAPGCPVAILDAQSGTTTSGAMKHEVPGYEGESDTPFLRGKSGPGNQHGGTGGASRFFNTFEPEYTAPFFYTGKASKKDKNADLEEEKLINKHPTVKAQSLMTHLVKLVTPPGGIVLDPFAGSGSTCVAALSCGMHFIGIEQEEEYLQIALARVRPAKDRAEVKMSQDSIFDLFVNGGDE